MDYPSRPIKSYLQLNQSKDIRKDFVFLQTQLTFKKTKYRVDIDNGTDKRNKLSIVRKLY